MEQNPFKNDHDLKRKLDQYEVHVPEFTIKSSKWDRLIYFLAQPAKNPLERIGSKKHGFLSMKLFPLGAMVIVSVVEGILLFF
ncbi:hypothetical protein [Falsibacillus pallidus]|uniref:Uncharacterized protein n=1 Tax=Falsibacillus pallidus TaxID=493781 RepID=A0A370G844_9BACI|nr:hypothetical protein [Falsibacillus pallidus]RDI39099.1 hypothetical protein DFR59_1156 [Falsibacillus pallidus]